MKTLKDMNVYQCLEDYPLEKKCSKEDFWERGVVDISDLKNEAIKWIKAIAQGTGDHIWFRISDIETAKEIIIQNQFTIRWIKEFFNITEEDLK